MFISSESVNAYAPAAVKIGKEMPCVWNLEVTRFLGSIGFQPVTHLCRVAKKSTARCFIIKFKMTGNHHLFLWLVQIPFQQGIAWHHGFACWRSKFVLQFECSVNSLWLHDWFVHCKHLSFDGTEECIFLSPDATQRTFRWRQSTGESWLMHARWKSSHQNILVHDVSDDCILILVE